MIYVLITAFLDRVRGGLIKSKHSFKRPASLLYGAMLAYLLGMDTLLWLPVALLWTVGSMPGWGYPIGQALHGIVQHRYLYPNAEPEWWQFGHMKNKPWISLAIRGFMWGFPCMLLYPFDSLAVAFPIAMAVALPLAVLVDKRFFQGYGEYIRGGLVAVFCSLIEGGFHV